MKSKFIRLPVLFLLTVLKINAQGFTLLTSAGSLLNYGDTGIVSGTTNDFDLTASLLVTNNSALQKAVSAERTLFNLVTGADNAFAWGIMMYPSWCNISVDPAIINAGATDNTFYNWCFSNGLSGVSYVKFKFYDDLNPTDNAWMVFEFNVVQVSGLNNRNKSSAIKIFSNLSDGLFHLTSDTNLSGATFAIYNQYGSTVLQQTIIENTNYCTIDLNTQPKEIYILRLKFEKGRTVILRLIKN